MDTKLKNSKTKLQSWMYGILWVLMVTAVLSTGVMSAVTAASVQIYRYNLDSDFSFGYHDEVGNWVPYQTVWTGNITNQAEFHDFMTAAGFSTVIQGAVLLVLLVLVLVFTGRRGLNWYDRIWAEIHIGSMLGFGASFVGLIILFYDLLPAAGWLTMFQSDYANASYYDIPNELAAVLIVTCMAGSAIFCLTSLVSLVKKLKAHAFWETSFFGGILLYLWRSVRRSDRTTLKAILSLLALSAVAGFCGIQAGMYGYIEGVWVFIGAAICLLLILLVVPEKTRKLQQLRQGAAEIRSGNLAYKIPVKPDHWGNMDELDRLAVDLNHIGEAQQAAVANELKNQRLKTELISNVSHDLKTPLTSMTAYIDLLKKEGMESENAREYLDIIDKKTQRLKVLTENLFEAAKASSGAMPVTMEELDLSALVTQSLAEMEEKLSEKGLTVIVRNECEDQPEGCKVLADGQLLWRIIENIMGNVSKYALAGSRVYVNLSKLESQQPDRSDRILLEVKNISAEPLNISAEELMERFKRGDESRNTEGSGLGLAISRDLAALMNGAFTVSIDGDLFKSCVALNEAFSARRIRTIKSATPEETEVPSKSDRMAFAAEKADAAMQTVRGAVHTVRQKVRRVPKKIENNEKNHEI